MPAKLGELVKNIRENRQSDLVLVGVYQCHLQNQNYPTSTADIRRAFKQIRLKNASQLNYARAFLKCASEGLLHDTGQRRGKEALWEITDSGIAFVCELLDIKNISSELDREVDALTNVARDVESDEVRDYLFEAIKCLAAGAMRASIVFTWSGAMRLVQQHLFDHFRGKALNDALEKHQAKVKQIHAMSDWAFVRDDTVLRAAADLRVFDRSQHKRLSHALDDRNDCGHPSSYKITPTKTRAIIEDLVNLVFKRTA